MATILVIDENCEKIKKQVEGVKGVYCFAENSVKKAAEHISDQQFDLVFCQVSFDSDELNILLDLLKNHQPPNYKLYWLAFSHEKEALNLVLDKIHNTFLTKPISKKDIEPIFNGELLEQDDIDSLVEDCLP